MCIRAMTQHRQKAQGSAAICQTYKPARSARRALLSLFGAGLLCTLAGCATGGPPTLTQLPAVVATYPYPVATNGVPKPVPSGELIWPPTIVRAEATARTARATQFAIAYETQRSYTRATYAVAQTVTSVARIQQIPARQTATAQALRATQTVFANQTSAATSVAPSQWGGLGLYALVLTDTVHLHFRCDQGDTFVPLRVDATGAFDLPGLYDWCPSACFIQIPAHFQGQITGARLTLTAVWTMQGEIHTAGPFTATLGQEPTLPPGCPICQDPGDRLGLRIGAPPMTTPSIPGVPLP